MVSSPNPGTSDNYLNAVAGLSAKDVWTVGYRYKDTLSLFQTVVEHWNGTSWSMTFSPDVDKYNNSFKTVAVISANDVWATGDYYNFNNNLYLTLVEHWDGMSWSIIPSPNLEALSWLNGIVAIKQSDIWSISTARHFCGWGIRGGWD